jgi:hypothetical protein
MTRGHRVVTLKPACHAGGRGFEPSLPVTFDRRTLDPVGAGNSVSMVGRVVTASARVVGARVRAYAVLAVLGVEAAA